MYKAMYIQELGSGDAQTFTYTCADYKGVLKLKPCKNQAGDLPLVYFEGGNDWRVAGHQREECAPHYSGWRDLDAIFDSPQGQRNRRTI